MPDHAAGQPRVVTYRYTFTFDDGTQRAFSVDLREDTLSLIARPRETYPEWTSLDFCRCPNCPLDPALHPRCPVAANLADLVESFRDSWSYEKVSVTVESKSRTYSRKGSLQTAVSALLGLFMTTSGCPILDKLRPMVDTHLPFMTRKETVYRMMTTYLMAQYFLAEDGRAPDWEMNRLPDLMEQVRTVNVSFCRRLNSIPIKDASVNALVILSTLGDFPSRFVTKGDLERWRKVFLRHYA